MHFNLSHNSYRISWWKCLKLKTSLLAVAVRFSIQWLMHYNGNKVAIIFSYFRRYLKCNLNSAPLQAWTFCTINSIGTSMIFWIDDWKLHSSYVNLSIDIKLLLPYLLILYMYTFYGCISMGYLHSLNLAVTNLFMSTYKQEML